MDDGNGYAGVEQQQSRRGQRGQRGPPRGPSARVHEPDGPYQGRSVSRTVQVVNNYGGTWEGTYVVRACTDTGDLTDHDGGWCWRAQAASAPFGTSP